MNQRLLIINRIEMEYSIAWIPVCSSSTLLNNWRRIRKDEGTIPEADPLLLERYISIYENINTRTIPIRNDIILSILTNLVPVYSLVQYLCIQFAYYHATQGSSNPELLVITASAVQTNDQRGRSNSSFQMFHIRS